MGADSLGGREATTLVAGKALVVTLTEVRSLGFVTTREEMLTGACQRRLIAKRRRRGRERTDAQRY